MSTYKFTAELLHALELARVIIWVLNGQEIQIVNRSPEFSMSDADKRKVVVVAPEHQAAA